MLFHSIGLLASINTLGNFIVDKVKQAKTDYEKSKENVMLSLAMKTVMGVSDKKWTQARQLTSIKDTHGKPKVIEIIPGVQIPRLASLASVKALQIQLCFFHF